MPTLTGIAGALQESCLDSGEVEAQVLACCLLEPELVDEAATQLDARDFHELKHQNLFALLVDIRNTGKLVAVSVVVQEAKNLRGGTESVGGIAYLAGLPDRVPSPSLFSYALDVLQKKSRLRGYHTAAHTVLNLLSEGGLDDDERLEEAASHLTQLLHRADKGGEIPIRDIVQKTIGEIERAFDLEGECTGIATGFLALDKLTGGFQPGDMIVLAARPSVGKTSLALNIADHVAVNDGQPVGFLSLEMNDTSLVKRMLSSRSEVNGHHLLSGNLTQRDITRLTTHAGKVARAPLFINDQPSLNITEMSAICRRMVLKHDCKLLVIDYLQLLHAKADGRVQEVSKISSAIKASAKELGVPILVLSQLSRLADGEAHPKLSHLRDSGAIEQDADLVLFLSRGEDALYTRLDLAKHRNGPVGDLDLDWDAEFTRYKNPTYWKVDNAEMDAT